MTINHREPSTTHIDHRTSQRSTDELSIFRGYVRPSRPRPLRSSEPAAPNARAPRAISIPADVIGSAILAVLEPPAASGESAEGCFRRKETELGAIFSHLSAGEAAKLRLRLTREPQDAVGHAFARLVQDRRRRLLDVLGDARRREAQPRTGGAR
jgi:hypothetical protein